MKKDTYFQLKHLLVDFNQINNSDSFYI